MARIHILVGSVTGKALSAAEAINAVYNEYQHHPLVSGFTKPASVDGQQKNCHSRA
jgi:flavodoxin